MGTVLMYSLVSLVSRPFKCVKERKALVSNMLPPLSYPKLRTCPLWKVQTDPLRINSLGHHVCSLVDFAYVNIIMQNTLVPI